MSPATDEYAAHISGAQNCRALAQDCRRRVPEYAAIGRHAWAFHELVAGTRHFERARWHIWRARMIARHITPNHERIAA